MKNAPTAMNDQSTKNNQLQQGQYSTDSAYLKKKDIDLGALQSACHSTVEVRQGSIVRHDEDGNRIAPYEGQFLFRELVNIKGDSSGFERILPERISKEAGSKPNDKFSTPGSKVSGTFTPIGFDVGELISMSSFLIVCAGLADGYRLHQATGLPVACCVGENNIKSVVEAIIPLQPNLFAAVDNDEAGHRAGESLAIPWCCPNEVKDWSDLYQADGSEAVKAQFEDNIKSCREQAVEDTEKPRFRLVRAGELEFRPPKFLIRHYVEADSLALIFGDPGCGKSFAAIDMACCIATGNDFHGHCVKQGPVIYIAGEGQNGLRRRLSAWEIRNGQKLDEAPLYVSTSPAALCDGGSALDVAAAVDLVAAEHGAPALVVVDTVARNFGPGDENSTQDMGQFVQAADMIRSRHECTVLLVHHTGHADKGRARGAMALKGALDAEYRMDKDEAGVVRMEATKMKDAAEPEPLAFRLRTVELGMTDDEGNEITSAILDDTEYQPPPVKGKAGKGKWQTVAREQLEVLHKERAANLERSGHDPEMARVSVEEWRNRCMDNGMPRQRFTDIRESDLARIENGFVWPR